MVGRRMEAEADVRPSAAVPPTGSAAFLAAGTPWSLAPGLVSLMVSLILALILSLSGVVGAEIFDPSVRGAWTSAA
jgi:hypothetical protein